MKNIDWDKVIKKSWYWTKSIFCMFWYHNRLYEYTFNPNEYAEKRKYLKSQKMII